MGSIWRTTGFVPGTIRFAIIRPQWMRSRQQPCAGREHLLRGMRRWVSQALYKAKRVIATRSDLRAHMLVKVAPVVAPFREINPADSRIFLHHGRFGEFVAQELALNPVASVVKILRAYSSSTVYLFSAYKLPNIPFMVKVRNSFMQLIFIFKYWPHT